MMRAPAILKQDFHKHLVRQRVLKSVFEVGKQACLVNKFRRLKIANSRLRFSSDSWATPWSKANGKSLPITEAH